MSRRTGVPASTLRYYEEKGLIASIGRRGLRRLFDPAILERLAMIALGRAGGFALDEISAMLTPDGLPKMDQRRLDAKANELDNTIRRLTAIREAL
ncbi:MerR family transcriptional regulator, partial [Mesorhizobium sp. M2E.F.Ca.ET.154.01.1.1]|uniref:MerR family transcriptional regulator n=1 Tax=Mesorhizobium sp. M2E.F.Ca.ET.154.01.1.1 TaxID=2500521 RepID=UPI001FEE7EC0